MCTFSFSSFFLRVYAHIFSAKMQQETIFDKLCNCNVGDTFHLVFVDQGNPSALAPIVRAQITITNKEFRTSGWNLVSKAKICELSFAERFEFGWLELFKKFYVPETLVLLKSYVNGEPEDEIITFDSELKWGRLRVFPYKPTFDPIIEQVRSCFSNGAKQRQQIKSMYKPDIDQMRAEIERLQEKLNAMSQDFAAEEKRAEVEQQRAMNELLMQMQT